MSEKKKTSALGWVLRGFMLLLAIGLGVTLYEVETYRSRLPVPKWDETKEVGLTVPFGVLNFTMPTWAGQAPGEPTRMWVAESKGRLLSFDTTVEGDEPRVELDLTDRVEQGGELGFYGIAFHPEFASNGTIFASYTSKVGGTLHSRISRFKRNEDGGFDRDAEEIMLRVDQPYETHNGGSVVFGPDGYLYIGLGDGGMAGDLHDHAQDPNELLGKVLRVIAKPEGEFGIPPDNPWADGEGGRPEVYAIGFRNPWRISFDRKTGELWLGDVGQDAYEEVNRVEKGKNYGWPIFEGFGCYDPPAYFKVFGWGDCDDADNEYTPPLLDYSHGGDDLSVTGGYVYRGPGLPQIQGHYIYGDFVSGKIWAYDPAAKKERLLLDTPLVITTFWQLHDGRVGVVDYASGGMWVLDVPKSERESDS